jgi:hypothetical protein
VNEWKPDVTLRTWEGLVAEVETVEKTEDGKILVYLHWYAFQGYADGRKNGRKSCHDASTVYQKCPQQVCPPTPCLTSDIEIL